jgi:hypothetical protein
MVLVALFVPVFAFLGIAGPIQLISTVRLGLRAAAVLSLLPRIRSAVLVLERPGMMMYFPLGIPVLALLEVRILLVAASGLRL